MLARTLLVGALFSLGLVGACATDEPGVTPPRDRFYFPAALALDPEWNVLYVASANADLQFNSGTLDVVKLDKLPADLAHVGQQVGKTIDCHADPFDPTVWECFEEQFVETGATLKIGDLASDLTVTPPAAGSQPRQRRVFVPVRGANRLVWADAVRFGPDNDPHYDLRCTSSAVGACAPGAVGDCESWECDDAHRVFQSPDGSKTLPDEPYSIDLNTLTAVWVEKDGSHRTCLDGGQPEVSCDCTGRCCSGDADTECCVSPPPLACPAAPASTQQVDDHIYLSHALGGEISFLISGPAGVVLRDVHGGFFTPDSTGVAGGFGLATLRPGDPTSLTYASSRVNSSIASFLIQDNARIIDATRTSMAGPITPANDVRGLAFGPGGTRMYAIDRLPSSLVAFDMTALDSQGLPRQDPLWAVPVCGEPSLLRLGPNPLHPDDKLARLAYVVCFGAGQIFVVDTDQGRVVDQIVTGKGPNGLVIDSKGQRAFVANYLDNTVGVIDLNPANPSYDRMVLRIGHDQYLIRATQNSEF